MRRVILVVAMLAVVSGAVWFTARRGEKPSVPPVIPSADVATTSSNEHAPANAVQPEATSPNGGKPAEPEELKPQPQHFGKALPVKASASPQAAAVSEALRTKQHPERLSALIAPKPFDRAAFEANPDAYLRIVEPGRVFQCAQPGKDVPALAVQSPSMSRIKQGETVKLAVKGTPLAPVSFTAFDMGEFAESKLNCVTVRADKDGVATVTFLAAPGALNDCNILAGSPLASGQVKFVVVIEEAGVR